jgi:hypothetical protein
MLSNQILERESGSFEEVIAGMAKDDLKETWEFQDSYYCPDLLLTNKSIESLCSISANLVGQPTASTCFLLLHICAEWQSESGHINQCVRFTLQTLVQQWYHKSSCRTDRFSYVKWPSYLESLEESWSGLTWKIYLRINKCKSVHSNAQYLTNITNLGRLHKVSAEENFDLKKQVTFSKTMLNCRQKIYNLDSERLLRER